MATFSEIIDKYRKKSFSEKDKGTRFEMLMQRFMQTYPPYFGKFSDVWLWNEFPARKDFGGKDLGIDLVAKTVDGEYWAVQCKCYAESARIDKPAVDSFLATSSKGFIDELGQSRFFSQRLWIATTNYWNHEAELSIQNQQPQVSRINLLDLQTAPVDWDKLDEGLFGDAASVAKFPPRPHQIKAIEAAHNTFLTENRGKLIMACGTGKTATSLWIAEKETAGKGVILFLVPSIALLSQSLLAWSSQSQNPLEAVCICSDASASKSAAKNQSDENQNIDLALPATTDVNKVTERLHKAINKSREGMVVVFSTYQSIDVISEAQKILLNSNNVGIFADETRTAGDSTAQEKYIFDMIICDEAHRTASYVEAGSKKSNFVNVHDNDFIKAKKRLYMTATPKLFGSDVKKKAEEKDIDLCSMDDEDTFGKEMFRIGFSEAVDKKLLSDYKVIVFTIGENEIPPALQDAIANKNAEINTDDASKLIGCINALSKRMITDSKALTEVDPAPMHKALAFCATIAKSKQISTVFNTYKDAYYESMTEEQREATVIVEADHVDGSMGATTRSEKLAWLQDTDTSGKDCHIVTNVRCMSEGVDVPSLDAILFLSARNSQVDVVQSVGRVMRTAPNKKFGYIIIPVVVPANVSPEEALNESKDFGTVWSVLNALRAHDDRFNATINKIELNKNKPDNILIGGMGADEESNGSASDGEVHEGVGPYQGTLYFSELQDAIYARMVQKVGNKRYWSQWAADIAKIAERHKNRIIELIGKDEKHKNAFKKFMDGLHSNINPYVKDEEAIEMLAQHIITKPVFEALFENYSFVENNVVSQSMAKILNLLDDDALDKDNETLERFYQSVRSRCEGVDNAEAKQKIITELYDNFFKVALKTTVEKLGIVYTPVEVVDFILHSVNDVLKKEFNRSLSDQNVHILDPFTGTGTFITRLLQSGIIKEKDLIRKYTKELHANEIVLLAYYIASINIENAFHDLMQGDDYTSFDGICLTDTFQLGENGNVGALFSEVFPNNSMRVQQQKIAPIRVIVGNPPWSAGQKSTNDNAMNESYPHLEERISQTYAKYSSSNNLAKLYDSYIKAIRWASDRIDQNEGGVIGFVTNSGWLDGNAMDGMRICLEKEFSSIYVLNLRGSIRGRKGEAARKEGQNVFDVIAGSDIVILVKNNVGDKCNIYYHDMGDYLSKKEKLDNLKKYKSCFNKSFNTIVVHPNAYGDWINHRSDTFGNLIPLNGDGTNSLFNINSVGVNTGRDAWSYNCSKNNLSKNIKLTINYYNDERVRISEENNDVNIDAKRIAWSGGLKDKVKKNKIICMDENAIRESMYRPFFKENLYYKKEMLERSYQMMKLFPYENLENKVICVSGVGGLDYAVLISQEIVNLGYVKAGNGVTQCFPLYYYEENTAEAMSLFDTDTTNKYTRKDGITDFILGQAQKLYGSKVTKEDIFYYVYGFLHLPSYREEFAADLKKSLPRIMLVDEPKTFWQLSKAGRELADIHLNYEHQPYPTEVFVEGESSGNFKVQKMKFKSKDNKSVLIYNKDITISNIPAKAHEYIVNGRSPLEWIIDRYQIKQDKASGIINDPNKWGEEHGNNRYILDLILSCITVSIKTREIVEKLPKINFY